MGFQFKVKLAAVMAVINGVAAALSYIASQGNFTITIVCTAISIAIIQGIFHYKDWEPVISNGKRLILVCVTYRNTSVSRNGAGVKNRCFMQFHWEGDYQSIIIV